MTEAVEKYKPMSPAEVVAQVKLVQDVMEAVMKKDEHYGTIPGTDKPTLLKPGAEKLSLTFRLAPEYDIVQKDFDGGHREYRITCTLKKITDGSVWGQGVGICSSMETKYRYRKAFESTGKEVPKAYWKDRDASLIGGKEFFTKKLDGKWMIVKVVEREENPDIADTYNTILKMAKKRAHVDAVLTATAASDIFTQDIGDEEEEGGTKTTKIDSPAGSAVGAGEHATAPGGGDGPAPPAGDASPLEQEWAKVKELCEVKAWSKEKVITWCRQTHGVGPKELDLLRVQGLTAHLREQPDVKQGSLV